MEKPQDRGGKPLWSRIWYRVVHHRVRITFIGFIFLFSKNAWEGVVPHSPVGLDDPLGLAGSAVLLAGLFLRSWAAGVVHKNQELATAGPYSLTRHPLYVGSFAMGLGFLLIVGDGLNIAVLLVLFLAIYLPKIRLEEQSVEGLFQEQWAEYVRRTARFFPKRIPRLSGTAWSLARWSSNREYVTLITGFALIAVLEALHRLALGEWGSS